MDFRIFKRATKNIIIRKKSVPVRSLSERVEENSERKDNIRKRVEWTQNVFTRSYLLISGILHFTCAAPGVWITPARKVSIINLFERYAKSICEYQRAKWYAGVYFGPVVTLKVPGYLFKMWKINLIKLCSMYARSCFRGILWKDYEAFFSLWNTLMFIF